MTDPIALVLGADDGFALPMAVSLHSALRHTGTAHDVRVTIVDGGLAPDTRDRLRETAQRARPGTEVRFATAPAGALDGLPKGGRFTEAAYLRLLIPDLVPESRALYLDSDVLVRRDLAPLYDEPFGDAPLLAVQDWGQPYADAGLGLFGFGIQGFEDFGLTATTPYFNSGLLVIDVDRWREEGIHRQALEHARVHHWRLLSHDQEALNVVLADRWKPLDLRWNVLHCAPAAALLPPTAFREAATAVDWREARVVHYSGDQKPWLFRRSNPFTPLFFDELAAMGL